MITVTLPPFVQEMIPLFCEKMYFARRSEKTARKKFGNLSEKDTHYNGFGAEYAVSWLLNCSFDWTLTSGNRGYDLEAVFPNLDGTFCKYKIESKWSSRENGSLLLEFHKVYDADIYVLSTGNFPTFNIVGWCSQAEALNAERKYLKPLDENQTIIVPQEQLHPFPDSLFTELQKRGRK